MKTKKKILAITGIRSEYDLLVPLLKGIEEDGEFDLGVIVSGAHLTPLHDYSFRLIEQDGFRIVERIESLLFSDSLHGKAKSTGLLISSLAQTLARENPDYLIILGDREECIAGSLTATYMNIPVIHLAGGDNTCPEGGDFDEQIRHATTKLSHVHLTMMEEHSERIRKLGEEEWRIHTVGSGGVDRLRTEPLLTKAQLAKDLGEGVLRDYIVLIYHPLSSQIEQAALEIENSIQACIYQGMDVFVGAPNSDPGSHTVIEIINKYSSHPRVHLYKNLSREIFVNFLRNAKALVGNSSLAIHEAPYLCLPAINVGERQKGRIAGKNVQFVTADTEKLRRALMKALNDDKYREEIKEDANIYGDGYMVEKSLRIIKSLPPRERLLAKKITY